MRCELESKTYMESVALSRSVRLTGFRKALEV